MQITMFLNIQVLFLIFFLYFKVNCSVYKSGIEDFTKCKVHYSKSESSYTKFYAINENHRENKSLDFDFHFSVIAPRDAHILLTPSPFITNSDPVYEIVLGAGGNSFSDLRRLQKKATKSSKRTNNLLSSVKEQSFWIHFSRDGLLEVGREGADIAFLAWKDPDPLPIQYFSFCTWGNVEAKWYYDCVREDGTTSDSQEVKKPLSTREKLRMDLFTNYDPYVRPTYSEDDLTIIHLGFKHDHVHLDEMSSKLIIQGVMQMQWLDEKINWDKTDYDDIDDLNLHFRELWQPNLFLYNSASGPGNDFSTTLRLMVTSEGWVTWVTRVKMEAWCDASGLGHWPQDHHTCEIQLGFLTLDNVVMIQAAVMNDSPPSKQYSSEWQITSTESGHYIVPTYWNRDSDMYSSSYVIRFTLRRSSNVYTTIYFAPIIVVFISLLVSFWVTPIGPYRISLYCFQLVLLSVVLTKLGTNLPAHPTEIPYLVLMYSYGFIAILVAIFFSILLMNWAYTKHTKSLPYFIYRFLSLDIIKTILYVQNSKFSDSYNKLIDENTNNSKDVDIQEMWNLLSLAIDRILFIIYFILAIICLSKQY